MKELNARLKSGKIDGIYVFSGAEVYLIQAYEKRLVSAVFGDSHADANTSVFEGEHCGVPDIIDAAETLPFLAGRRLIILRNTGLLQTGKKDASDRLAAYLPNAPETTAFLFVETIKPPDKRGKLYKTASKGSVTEFATPSEAELVSWIAKLFSSEGISINSRTAGAMLRHIGGSDTGGIMENLNAEARKLAAYKGYSGSIDIQDIEHVCTQSIEGKIFTLVKEIGTKNLNALTSLANLIAAKEPPLMILSMIARQFRLMLICKGLKDKGLTPSETARIAGLRDFMVSDFLNQARNFSEQALIKALSDILDAETGIKTGKVADRLAVELLIVGLSA